MTDTTQDATPEATAMRIDFQRTVGQWGEVTFPDSTIRSIMAHLREEVAELHDAVERQAFHDDIEERTTGAYRHEIAEESADVYMLILHLAHRCGFDLASSAREKFAENQLRTWHDDGRGYAKHVDATAMTHDTTDAAAHASAIRRIASHWATFFGPFIHNDNLWYTDTFMDGKDAGEIGSDMTEVDRHAAALDAARIAAEQRAERLLRLVEATPVDIPRASRGGVDAYWDAYYSCRDHGDLDAEPAPARAEGGA